MTHSSNISNLLPVEFVLDEFFYASEKPSKQLFQDFVARYPEYRYELASFAVHWLAAPEDLDDAVLSEVELSPADVLQVQSQVLSRIYADELKSISTQVRDIQQIRETLDTIKGATILGIVSEAVGLPSSMLLGKLLRGSISDFPKHILFRLARFLKTTPEIVTEAITIRSSYLVYNYSASDKPISPMKESWAEAVRREGLPKELESRLLFDHGNDART